MLTLRNITVSVLLTIVAMATASADDATNCEVKAWQLRVNASSVQIALSTYIPTLRHDHSDNWTWSAHRMRRLHERIRTLVLLVNEFSADLDQYNAMCPAGAVDIEAYSARLRHHRLDRATSGPGGCALSSYACRQLVTDRLVGSLNVIIDMQYAMGWSEDLE